MPLAHYFVGDRFFGSSPVRDEARSLAFFCPVCGEIWGRAVIEPAAGWDLHWNACEHHSNRDIYTNGQPPGSFLTALAAESLDAWAGHAGLLKSFPPALVEREFYLTINHAIKEQAR